VNDQPWSLPWPKPLSHYDSDGPRDGGPVAFQIAGVEFWVVGTNALAPTTLRTRYEVQCRTCDEVLHKATTGPTARIRGHLKEAHGFEGELRHAEHAPK
jgi:hypothetical protein